MLRWMQIAAMKDLAASSNAKVLLLGGGGKAGGTILDIK